jgi:hypothetical protein
MLMLGHISSLSFELGERHRLITIWLNTLLRLQVRTGIGCEVNLRWLIAPLQAPKTIPKEAGKAFYQVLQSVEHGYIHVGVPKWQSFFQSPLKLVPKVKVSCLNLNEVGGGRLQTIFFARRLPTVPILGRRSDSTVGTGPSRSSKSWERCAR